MGTIGDFCFYNIGQGLFYSGLIKNHSDDETFSFIYDCGSERVATRPVEINTILNDFSKSNIGSRSVDLLVMSHYHRDHLNGILQLIKKQKITVKRVVMPYLYKELSLLPLLESFEMEKEDFRLLFDFYSNPDQWLFDHGIKVILKIAFTDNVELPGEPITSDIIDDTIKYESNEMYIQNGYRGSFTLYTRFNISFSLNNHNYWRFQFACLDLPEVDQYQNLLKKEWAKLTQPNTTENYLLKLLELRKTLKPNNIRKMINRTSVIMMHYPHYTKVPILHCLEIINTQFFTRLVNGNIQAPITLLTGDINLNINEVLPFNDFIKTNKPLITLYPHHGSSNSENNIPYFKNLDSAIYVISYGCKNRHGHPNQEVLDEITNIVKVCEQSSFKYVLVTDNKLRNVLYMHEIN